MDTFQQNISQLDTDAMQDEALLEAAVSAWEVVCRENAEQRSLVTENQWSQWERFRDATAKDLLAAADSYGETGVLEEAARASVRRLLSSIARSTRKSREVLEEEAAQCMENERATVQSQQKELATTSARRSAGWRGRLKELVSG